MEEIVEKLYQIFVLRANIDFKELQTEALLGKRIELPARELMLICMDIEKEFKIRITEQDIILGKLKTFREIYLLISKYIN
mgnify:CR=1 FL=1